MQTSCLNSANRFCYKNELVKESNISLKTFIKNEELYNFYVVNLNNIVDNYELGSILYSFLANIMTNMAMDRLILILNNKKVDPSLILIIIVNGLLIPALTGNSGERKII